MIRLAPVARRLGAAATLVHTGQHIDAAMPDDVSREAGLAEPRLRLAAGGLPRGAQVGTALTQLDAWLASSPVRAVVVQGEANSTLAGALAAKSRGIPLVHVGAGLRSFDPAMPEETNRILVDHMAGVLCAATRDNAANLHRERVQGQIARTGSTIVEAVGDLLPPAEKRQQVLAQHSLTPDGYVLATVHRAENTDCPDLLAAVLAELGALAERLPVVLPLHPRTRIAVRRYRLETLLSPLTVLLALHPGPFLALARHAALLISDSGSLQEEATILKRPLIVVRTSTERPESLTCFGHLVHPSSDLIGKTAHYILDQGPALLQHLADLPSPFGDQRAADRIVRRIRETVDCAIRRSP
ncbi:UDP-N-acetyl glucosamine 2-epimerase [Streptoverticillium reticulum]|uniref:UDP-N-acetyl glucosamine 2-epimerase n=1 Tax=Streptoverticillium reticulum TaxID=1433415 RepID=UPI0039BEEFA7